MKSMNVLGVGLAAIVAVSAGAVPVSAPAFAGTVPISKTCSHLYLKGDFGRHLYFDGGRYRADNLCYAEGKHWQEVALSGKTVTLYQRFDYYRPNVPLDTPLPVIVWAHPYGETEDINDTSDGYLVQPAMLDNFVFVSIEFRHPIGSQPEGGGKNIPNTDVASAVQFVRQWAGEMGIQSKNVFLLGQSRGTLGLLTALMPDQKNKTSWKLYQHQSSRVNAMFGYQAQTSYIEDEIANTFITPETRDQFHADFVDVPMNPGSAIDEAGADDPPVVLHYDETPPDENDVVLEPYCPKGNTAVLTAVPCFDIHNPNFGVALKQAFISAGVPDRISLAYGFGGNASAAYAGYVEFFHDNLK